MKVNPLYLRIVFLITATLLTRRCYSLWVKIAKNENYENHAALNPIVINHYNIQVQLDLIHRTGSKTKPALINTKDGFYIVRNRLLHNQFNDFYLYRNNISHTISSHYFFYLHLFPLKIKFSPVIRQHTIYIFQPFFNYNFTK